MALNRVPHRRPRVTVGVDTHGEIHVAACVDEVGRILGTVQVTADQRGFGELLRFAERFGPVERFGVEGTGAYGAGLSRYLGARGHEVVEVDRPDRRIRRARGKSDPVDAETAARATLAGTARGTPKSRDGGVEMIRVLRVARRSAIRSRTQAVNQLHALVLTAPEELRRRLRGLRPKDLVIAAARLRHGPLESPVQATKLALSEIAKRYLALEAEVERLDVHLEELVPSVAPRLVGLFGIGTEVAAQLLVTAGDNPERLRSESSFAHLCGVAPLPASSGKTAHHRLNRGGDRQANQALWRIVMVRLSCEPRTRAYAARRRAEGLSKRDVIRCLKRYVAREVYQCLLDEA
jgi:transposase